MTVERYGIITYGVGGHDDGATPHRNTVRIVESERDADTLQDTGDEPLYVTEDSETIAGLWAWCEATHEPGTRDG